MRRFAANLTTMFTEVPFLERFAAAAAAGFEAVEYLFPYDHAPAEIARRLTDAGLQQVLFNAPPGDWEHGERGIAAIPGRDEEFTGAVAHALDYAQALDCAQIHVMAGIAPISATERYVERIQFAADEAAKHGRTITIEPINSRDMPDYFLAGVPQAMDCLQRIDRPNVVLQFDIYHAQIMHGDITRLLRTCIDAIGHVQIASVPDRQEPDDGEVNYRYVIDELRSVGYTGWIGCEYFPRSSTTQGLSWLEPYTLNGAEGKESTR